MKNIFLPPIFLFAAFSLLYFWGSFSKIPFGDCIGFVIYTEKSEFVWSTSTYAHFLFTNTLVAIKKIFPFWESVEIGRFVTLFSGALTISFLYLILKEITENTFFSFWGSVIFGLSFSFWRNAGIIEIYTFNMLIISVFIHQIILHIKYKNKFNLCFAAAFLGISFYSHIMNILLLPAFCVVLYYRKVFIKPFIIVLFFFLGLFVFPLVNSEDLSSVFSSGMVMNHLSFDHIFKNFIKSIAYLVYNFWWFLVFTFVGIFWLYKKNKLIFFFLAVSALPVFGFATVFGVTDNYVFFIPFNFIISIFIGTGLYSLREKSWIKAISVTSILVPLMYYQAYSFAPKFEKGFSFDQEKSYKGGLRYYLLPWMKNNVGIIEFTLEKRKSSDVIQWMTESAEEFIEIRKQKNQTEEEIKKL